MHSNDTLDTSLGLLQVTIAVRLSESAANCHISNSDKGTTKYTHTPAEEGG